jgi:excisionase family DNA binding protein
VRLEPDGNDAWSSDCWDRPRSSPAALETQKRASWWKAVIGGDVANVKSPAAGAPTTDELLDVGAAADALGTPVRFVRRLVAERRIRFYKIGRYVRIDRRDLDEFIAAGSVEPSAAAK